MNPELSGSKLQPSSLYSDIATNVLGRMEAFQSDVDAFTYVGIVDSLLHDVGNGFNQYNGELLPPTLRDASKESLDTIRGLTVELSRDLYGTNYAQEVSKVFEEKARKREQELVDSEQCVA